MLMTALSNLLAKHRGILNLYVLEFFFRQELNAAPGTAVLFRFVLYLSPAESWKVRTVCLPTWQVGLMLLK